MPLSALPEHWTQPVGKVMRVIEAGPSGSQVAAATSYASGGGFGRVSDRVTDEAGSCRGREGHCRNARQRAPRRHKPLDAEPRSNLALKAPVILRNPGVEPPSAAVARDAPQRNGALHGPQRAG